MESLWVSSPRIQSCVSTPDKSVCLVLPIHSTAVSTVSAPDQEPHSSDSSEQVFTGGYNRALWQPAPGVQTLRLLHRHIDLTPLITLLNDGKEHMIQIDVGLAGSTVKPEAEGGFFYITGTVLAWADAELDSVVGTVVTNTLEDCLDTRCLAPVLQDGVATKSLQWSISARQTHVPRIAAHGAQAAATTHAVKFDSSIEFYGDGAVHNTTTTEPSAGKSRVDSFTMHLASGASAVRQEFRSERHGYAQPGYASTVTWTDSASGEGGFGRPLRSNSTTFFSFSDNAGNDWTRTLGARNGIRSSSTETGSLAWWVDPFFGMRASPKTVG